MTARAFFLLALLTGCAGSMDSPHFIREGNYLTFQHAYTEAAGSAVRQRAEKLCGEQKRAAVRTSGVCSLTRCTTHYQCMDEEDAARASPPPAR
jgi:hypothetical protein